MKLKQGTVSIAAVIRNVASESGGFMTKPDEDKPDEDYGIPRRWITLFFVALTVAFIILAFVIGNQGTQGRRSSRALCAGLVRFVDNLALGAEASQTESQPDW